VDCFCVFFFLENSPSDSGESRVVRRSAKKRGLASGIRKIEFTAGAVQHSVTWEAEDPGTNYSRA
jgi:hypothetical protein